MTTPLTAAEWLEQNATTDSITQNMEQYAAYLHAELSRPPKDVVEAIEKKYPHLERQEGLTYHSMKMHNDHADLLRTAALHGYSLAAGKSVRFAEWCSLNYIWDHGNTWHNKNMKDINVYTTEQLYSIFKKESNG